MDSELREWQAIESDGAIDIINKHAQAGGEVIFATYEPKFVGLWVMGQSSPYNAELVFFLPPVPTRDELSDNRQRTMLDMLQMAQERVEAGDYREASNIMHGLTKMVVGK